MIMRILRKIKRWFVKRWFVKNEHYIGGDPANTSGDKTVFVVMEKTKDGNLKIVDRGEYRG